MAITMLDAADFTKTFAYAAPLAADVNTITEGSGAYPRWIKFGVGGTVHVEYANGTTDTFDVQSGDVMPVKACIILCDTTTAEQITVGY